MRKKAPLNRKRRRKLLAGFLFGTLMSGTLVLLGYEARTVWERNPELRDTVSGWFR